MKATAIALAGALLAGTASAGPSVATDIPPIHSLVARVMQGVGEPALILPPGASPHTHAMRPSEAAALADAELVFWVGETLTPWFGRAVASLAQDAVSVELLDAPGTVLLPVRDRIAGASDISGEDGEGQGGQNAGRVVDHGHGGVDPHAWLDPRNALAWLASIAGALSRADPANAATYVANAAAARAELDMLAGELETTLGPVRDRPFVAYHDAYRYFETRFGLASAGAIAVSDASAPSPARIEAIRAALGRLDAGCVFAEPQFDEGLVATVTEGTRARAATLDPVGVTLTPGPALYPQLLRDLAAAIADCLGAP